MSMMTMSIGNMKTMQAMNDTYERTKWGWRGGQGGHGGGARAWGIEENRSDMRDIVGSE